MNGYAMKVAAQNMLIRGVRGAGKTYLIERVLAHYENSLKIAGFFTKKEETGDVTLQPWDNFQLMDKGPRMNVFTLTGKKIHKNVFEELGVWSIDRAISQGDLLVFDELGRFEIHCTGFLEAVHRALDHENPVIAAVKAESNPFLDSLVRRKDCRLFTVVPENRESLFSCILEVWGEKGI
jgi:nucleoside-triphosphatase THEP1